MTNRTSGLLMPAAGDMAGLHTLSTPVQGRWYGARSRAASQGGWNLRVRTHAESNGGNNDLHAVVRPVGLHLLALLLAHGRMVVAAVAAQRVMQALSASQSMPCPREEHGLREAWAHALHSGPDIIHKASYMHSPAEQPVHEKGCAAGLEVRRGRTPHLTLTLLFTFCASFFCMSATQAVSFHAPVWHLFANQMTAG